MPVIGASTCVLGHLWSRTWRRGLVFRGALGLYLIRLEDASGVVFPFNNGLRSPHKRVGKSIGADVGHRHRGGILHKSKGDLTAPAIDRALRHQPPHANVLMTS